MSPSRRLHPDAPARRRTRSRTPAGRSPRTWRAFTSMRQAAELLPDPPVEGLALELGEAGDVVVEVDVDLLARLQAPGGDAIGGDVDRVAIGDVDHPQDVARRDHQRS